MGLTKREVQEVTWKQQEIKESLEDVLDYEHSTLVSDNAGNITGFADEQEVSYEAYDSEEHGGKLDMINWLHRAAESARTRITFLSVPKSSGRFWTATRPSTRSKTS